jgi:hypothetical protein
VQAPDGALRLGAQLGSKGDVAAAFGLDVVDSASRNRETQHFFQTQGLGTKLNVIVIPATPLAALVLDREGRLAAVVRQMKFNNVRLAGEPEPVGLEKDAMGGPNAPRGLVKHLIGTAMAEDPFDRKAVVDPKLLDAQHGTPSWTEQEMVQ